MLLKVVRGPKIILYYSKITKILNDLWPDDKCCSTLNTAFF